MFNNRITGMEESERDVQGMDNSLVLHLYVTFSCPIQHSLRIRDIIETAMLDRCLTFQYQRSDPHVG
jgi:hypothetical protein